MVNKQQLVDLDESFEAASSIVPHFILRSFSKARNEIRSSLQKYTTEFNLNKEKVLSTLQFTYS